MDNIDYKILRILQKNARETASNISKSIHLSASCFVYFLITNFVFSVNYRLIYTDLTCFLCTTFFLRSIV